MVIVLDNSAALAIAFQEPNAQETPSLVERIAREGAVVPALWRCEFANGLAMVLRYDRASRSDIERQFVDFGALPIMVDEVALDRAWSTTVAMAEQHRLTVYDAAYLELTIRHSLPLATFDKALARAARDEGVEVIGG
ncbi:MAG: type II toxin-antitoxin system VapC family toxin [Chloroflexia bacterium]|nr:type II toxin-antitoxin system VapC family toxin [Chloroflexia bacterium]